MEQNTGFEFFIALIVVLGLALTLNWNSGSYGG